MNRFICEGVVVGGGGKGGGPMISLCDDTGDHFCLNEDHGAGCQDMRLAKLQTRTTLWDGGLMLRKAAWCHSHKFACLSFDLTRESFPYGSGSLNMTALRPTALEAAGQ